jgi:hypothetical protein
MKKKIIIIIITTTTEMEGLGEILHSGFSNTAPN